MADKNIAQAGPGPGGLPPMPEVIEMAPVKKPIDYKRIGFITLGIALFALFYLAGELHQATDPMGKVFKLSRQGQMAIGLFLMAGTWWVFEVLPIGVTSIMIGVMQALFMIRKPDDALRDFFDPSVWFIF